MMGRAELLSNLGPHSILICLCCDLYKGISSGVPIHSLEVVILEEVMVGRCW